MVLSLSCYKNHRNNRGINLVCPFFKNKNKICQPIQERLLGNRDLFLWHLKEGYCSSEKYTCCCPFQIFFDYQEENPSMRYSIKKQITGV